MRKQIHTKDLDRSRPTFELQKQSQFKANLLALTVALLTTLACKVCLAGSEAQALGKLRIEGKYIEHLVLLPKDGPAVIFNDPNGTVRLPVGEYWVNEVRLKGGYRRQTARSRHPIVIGENAPASLTEGGPLKHTVSVVRRGRVLELSYRLSGIGGETYASPTGGGEPPAFAVCKGDRQIVAGKFEFG